MAPPLDRDKKSLRNSVLGLRPWKVPSNDRMRFKMMEYGARSPGNKQLGSLRSETKKERRQNTGVNRYSSHPCPSWETTSCKHCHIHIHTKRALATNNTDILSGLIANELRILGTRTKQATTTETTTSKLARFVGCSRQACEIGSFSVPLSQR